MCKRTYLNLYSLALITLTSLFTERNDAECFLLSPLSNTKLDRLQIKDQRGRFHYQAISLFYHTNNLLKLSAIIFSPFRRRHRVLASEMTVILSSCLCVCVCVCVYVCVRVCEDNGSFSLCSSAKNIIHHGSQETHTHMLTHTHTHTLTNKQEKKCNTCIKKNTHPHTYTHKHKTHTNTPWGAYMMGG